MLVRRDAVVGLTPGRLLPGDRPSRTAPTLGPTKGTIPWNGSWSSAATSCIPSTRHSVAAAFLWSRVSKLSDPLIDIRVGFVPTRPRAVPRRSPPHLGETVAAGCVWSTWGRIGNVLESSRCMAEHRQWMRGRPSLQNRTRPLSDRCRPNLAEVDQAWLDCVQTWFAVDHLWAYSAKFGSSRPNLAASGQIWPYSTKFGHIRSNLGHIRLIVGCIQS